MGKQFFVGWELWQKMTFVLACGIVLTIFIGLVKLRIDTYRIAKYTKIEKGKQTQTPEMLEAQRVETRDDVPFGIRAIESGIEIDGVWISRSNTPAGSSRSSMTDVKIPRSHNNSNPELPQLPVASSRNSSQAPSSFDMAVNAERIPTNDSRSSSPGRHVEGRHAEGRSRPPVSMTTRYSSYTNISRNSATLQVLEGAHASSSSSARREPVSEQTSAGNSQESSGKSSRRTSDESDYMALNENRPYEAAYIHPRQKSVAMPFDPRTDLDLLQSHRLSHVAETGQLTPRVRRPGNSGDWAAEHGRLPEEISTVNGVDYFVPQQKTPSPPPAPVEDPSRVAPMPLSSQPLQDGHVVNQAKQSVPLLESYAPRPFYLPETYQPRGPHHQFSYEEVPIEVNTSQNQRGDSQVLRKVNSGFEILRPGTFAPPSPEEEEKMAANSEKRQSRRLQKKRRASSSGSRTSQFVEQV